MYRAFSFLALAAMGLSTLGLAAQDANMGVLRGGFGFIYPDYNSFANPSQFAGSQATSLQADYNRVNGSKTQTATPSLVHSSNRVGLGAYASRASENLFQRDGSVDSAGAGLGVGLVRDRINVGVGYGRQIGPNQPDSGKLSASATFGSRMTGQSLAVVAGTNLGASRKMQTGTISAGYSFRPGTNFEVALTVNDFNDAKHDYIASAFLNVASPIVYFSTGYNWLNAVNKHMAMGRLGFVLSRSCDFSAYGGTIFMTGAEPTYGGTLRVMF